MVKQAGLIAEYGYNYESVHVNLRSIYCTGLEKRLIDCTHYYDDGNSASIEHI